MLSRTFNRWIRINQRTRTLTSGCGWCAFPARPINQLDLITKQQRETCITITSIVFAVRVPESCCTKVLNAYPSPG